MVVFISTKAFQVYLNVTFSVHCYSYLFRPIGEHQDVLTCVHLECFMHFFNFKFSMVLASVSSEVLMWSQA